MFKFVGISPKPGNGNEGGTRLAGRNNSGQSALARAKNGDGLATDKVRPLYCPRESGTQRIEHYRYFRGNPVVHLLHVRAGRKVKVVGHGPPEVRGPLETCHAVGSHIGTLAACAPQALTAAATGETRPDRDTVTLL